MMYDTRKSRVPRKPSDWRGATEVSAGPTGVGASWLIELGRRFQSEQTCFVMLGDIENSLCKL